MMDDHAWSDLPSLQYESGSNEVVLSQTDGAADVDAEIARLAKLPMIQRDRELPVVAKKLRCRVPTLRAAVAAERGSGTITGQGQPLDLPEPTPWPEPVDGAALLDTLAKVIRQYTILSERQ